MSENLPNVGTWVLFPWFEEHSNEVHPEDLRIAQAIQPYGKVLEVVGVEEGFVVLAYGDERIRVRPGLVKVVPEPVAGIGSIVTLTDGRTGELLEVNWHHGCSEPYYTLRVEGKRKSKRYWNGDISGGDEPNPTRERRG